MKIITLSSLLVLLYSYEAIAVKLPGPLVYVVTPSSQPRADEGRSAPQPFYYHNWMRRMDSPSNATYTTTTTTTVAPKKVITPDLIFAEFESDKMKNIRKLLEKERIDKKPTTTTTTTTMKPIYVPNDDSQDEGQQNVNYALPSEKEEVKTNKKDMNDYFALYNNMYNVNNSPPAPAAPVYLPKTTPRTTTTSTTTTTPAPVHNVESIWNIIDSQKQEQYTGQWDEVPIGPDSDKGVEQDSKNQSEEEEQTEEKPENYDNFALPGFGTNPVGGENESRAIRTEPSIRFPYVNLKPFQMKNQKRPLHNSLSNSKKGSNMFTNLDNFVEVKNPVRGEAQEVPMREPIDRYNPAQSYLSLYGGKKDTSYKPAKTVANLIPPPPPPPPKVTDDDFPAPSSYEQFPPFAPPTSDNGPPSAPAPAVGPPTQTIDSDDSDSGPGDDGAPMDLGYRYKAPAAPSQNFLPTLPPLQKPAGGYSYNKPPMSSYDAPLPSYKPPLPSYDAPPPSAEAPPMDSDFQGYNYDKPSAMPSKPDFSGYQYKKPEPPAPVAPSPSYGNNQGSDYPELIFDKPHKGHGPKGSDSVKGGADSMGMVPPPVADVMPGPPDDSGFPHDFPGDFKYSHDFDDHDFHHYHHDHTTTTEMPRVNRFSYYYLGKKLYYLPLYFSVYFIVYVGALIIKAVLRHKIVYPNSWRPNDQTATFFNKRSVDSEWDSSEKLHEITGRVTRAIATAAERYMKSKKDKED